MDDVLIKHNPCRIKGADTYDVPDRLVLSLRDTYAVADAIQPQWRALVLLTTSLRSGSTLRSAAGVAPRDLMAILGHRQIAVTMEVYTHVVQEKQREACGTWTGC
ncbi:hypothetical protein [Streptomyces sp. NRRL S-350]|uniref:hypothetical protein n=1 Tax=Streptomyces sp. NRRL S-350 TaxID=1463902 RepID=UPI002D21B91F|nr:hypothetical protein [Streptomyces sp. NRRL S-350]